jgi:Tol biopolymer transport system component
MIGRTLGHYKILEKLGSGGMGQVFAAEDTKLSRKVALKLLPEEMASSQARLSRFEREAKAVAAFNHPNIVTIHSVENAEGLHFIVMELVRGRRLSELIPTTGMPLARFLEIAIPVASAVSAAHQQGITHRDLKPDNIMVTDEGQVKILDFGLAKPRREPPSPGRGSELPTEHLTEEGAVLGTVAYMSPEQAKGKKVDHRSDIFSLGVVFYEMLTGWRPFHGDSPASVLSAILRDTPASMTDLNPVIPRDLDRIVKRCLVKDPDHRYQTAKDVRNELEDLKRQLDSGEALEGGVAATPRAAKKKLALASAAAVLLSIAVIFVVMRSAPEEEGVSPSPVQGTFRQITLEAGRELNPSLSPDGALVVYQSRASGNWDIYQQRVGGEKGFNLTEDSTVDDTQPAFSPDGESIAFRSERDGGGIFLMGATGESVRRLTDFGFNPSWSPDGQSISFATEGVSDPLTRGATSQIWTIAVANGERHLITEGDAVHPSFSPHGRRIAYWSNSGGQRDIGTVDSEGGELIPVTRDIDVDWNPVWSPDGRYLYFSSNRGGSMNLWRVPIDEKSGKVLGEPEPLTTPSPYVSGISVAKDGNRLAYASEASTSHLWKVGFDPSRETVEEHPVPITRGSRLMGEHDVSPDGKWLAAASSGSRESIFVLREDGTGLRQLTDDPHRNLGPLWWSPDGRQIAFFSNRTGSWDVWIIHPDGSGLRPLAADPGRNLSHPVWSPDGSRMASVDGSDTVLVFDPRKPPREQSPETLPGFEHGGDSFWPCSWSPDGNWLAGYLMNPGVGIWIYSLESRELITLTDFGAHPVWLSDSQRLLFHDEGKLYIVDRASKEPKVLFAHPQGELLYPALSRDNRTIYFALSSLEADIWLLTLN